MIVLPPRQEPPVKANAWSAIWYRTLGQIVDAVNGFKSPAYTVATLPTPGKPGRVVFVSNASGGAVLAFDDGTNFRRVTDRAIVS